MFYCLNMTSTDQVKVAVDRQVITQAQQAQQQQQMVVMSSMPNQVYGVVPGFASTPMVNQVISTVQPSAVGNGSWQYPPVYRERTPSVPPPFAQVVTVNMGYSGASQLTPMLANNSNQGICSSLYLSSFGNVCNLQHGHDLKQLVPAYILRGFPQNVSEFSKCCRFCQNFKDFPNNVLDLIRYDDSKRNVSKCTESIRSESTNDGTFCTSSCVFRTDDDAVC